MTNLSPAAQAVLDAFRSSHTGPGCLAAALRALSDRLGYEVLNVRSVDCSQIELIAAELEGNNE